MCKIQGVGRVHIFWFCGDNFLNRSTSTLKHTQDHFCKTNFNVGPKIIGCHQVIYIYICIFTR